MTDYKILSAKAADAHIKYLTFGSGKKPLVIIPGLSIKSVLLSANAVVNAYSCFNESHTVYLFDRREEMQTGVTVFDTARDIAAAMKIIGIKNADVFGTSQGGMIAQILALEYPELVSGLVLGSSAARLHPLAKDVTGRWCRLAENGKTEELCRDFIAGVYSRDFAQKYGEMLVHMMSDCTKEELLRFAACAHSSDGFDVTDRIGNIKCPILVLGAENDAVLSGDASREIAEITGCEIYMYGEPYGHAVYDEAPDYKDRLIKFFG